MIFDILKDATDYTNINRNALKNLSVLYILSFLIVPLFIIEGYVYNIIKESLNGTINVPEKISPLNIDIYLLKNGIKLFFVKFVYLLPFIVIYLYGIFHFNEISLFLDEYTILVGILLLLGFFLSTIASVHMIETESIIKAFNLIDLWRIIKEIGIAIYFKLFLSMLIVLIGTSILAFFFIAIVSLVITWTLIIEYKVLTILLSIILFIIILLPVYTIFKNRAITSIYNLR